MNQGIRPGWKGLLAALSFPAALAMGGYHDNAQLEAALKAIDKTSDVVVSKFAEDSAGRTIWMARAGGGSDSDPAILVVAGLDGRHLVGTEMALRLLEKIAGDDEAMQDLFADRTLYVIPRLNLHGADAFFGPLRQETAGIAGESDHDKDGLIGEDLHDDLNGDGMISWVRVRDRKGTMTLDGEEDSLLREADVSKGEVGEWLLFREGFDNDKDERFDEEADGGVHLHRNFTHKYPYLKRNAGWHQVSEVETRALADFVVANRNIAAVVLFGPEDNLFSSPGEGKGVDVDVTGGRWGRDPITELIKHDVPYFRHFGEEYRELFNLDKDLKIEGASDDAGSFAGFVNLTRGRFTLATPAWSPELQLALNKKSGKGDDEEEKKKEKPAKDKDAEKVHDSLKTENDFLKWAKQADPERWLGWTEIEHPDFPGQEAHVGGWAPFAKINPPAALLDELATSHTLLLKHLAGKLPRVEIAEAVLSALAGGIHELNLVVANSGYLPDVLAQGRWSTHVRPTRVEIEGAEVIGAGKRILLDPIPGNGGHQELRLLLKLPEDADSLLVRVVSELGGTEQEEVTVSTKEDQP